MTPEEYLNSPNESCPLCREPKDDVKERFDAYADACGNKGATHRMCGDCAHQRYMDS